jgi:hypothetical protein
MRRTGLSESDFRWLRHELARRAHETAKRIETKVKMALQRAGEATPAPPPIEPKGQGDGAIHAKGLP